MPPGEVTDKYPLFLFAGMLPWMLFNETLTRSASSLLEQANLITKTVFPAEIIPVSVFLSSLASHLLALTLMIVVTAVYLNQISIFLILLPVYIFVLGLLAVGLGWIVASLQVFLRDTAQILTVVLTFWFWLTPIFLAASQFPRGARGPAGGQSFLLPGAGLPRPAVELPRTGLPRSGGGGGLRRRRIYCRRLVLPPYEARLRGRPLNSPS